MAIWPNCHSWEVGRNASSVFLIIDAQSVKNTKPVALKGYDVGKKKGSSVGANALQLFTEPVTKLAGQYGYLSQPFVQGVQEILDVHVTVQSTKRRKPQGVSHWAAAGGLRTNRLIPVLRNLLLSHAETANTSAMCLTCSGLKLSLMYFGP